MNMLLKQKLNQMLVAQVIVLSALALSTVTLSASALAQPMASPFSAEVAVESQDPRQRRRAAESGLLDVLVRISGSERVRDNSRIRAQSSDAIRYVEQFEYRELADPKQIAMGKTALVKMQFSERFVKELLRDAGENLWSLNRPSALVWLVEDSVENGKQMVGPGHDSELVQGLLKGANYRGVPLQFPLLDFEDQVAINVQRLWNFDENAIMEASERYQPGLVLVGTYTTTSSGDIWSNWQYFFNGRSRLYDFRGQEGVGIGQNAIGVVADFLAQKYAVQLSTRESDYYYAKVSNISSYRDYRGLMQALKNLDTISDILLDGTAADTLSLRFKSDGTVAQLRGLLGLNRQLQSVTRGNQQLPSWEQAELGSAENPLLYAWAPR